MTIFPGTFFSQDNFLLLRLISSSIYLVCNYDFLKSLFRKHTVSSMVYRILPLITTMSGIDELNNAAELLYPSTSANTSYSFVLVSRIKSWRHLNRPLLIAEVRLLRKWICVWGLTHKSQLGESRLFQVTGAVEGEIKGFSEEIESIWR